MIAGAVYLYYSSGAKTQWSQAVKLVASDRAAGDRFGNAVAVYQKVVVVGAPYDDIGAYIDIGIVVHISCVVFIGFTYILIAINDGC